MIRKFDTPHDLMSLRESIVVNCAGRVEGVVHDDELVRSKKVSRNAEVREIIGEKDADFCTTVYLTCTKAPR